MEQNYVTVTLCIGMRRSFNLASVYGVPSNVALTTKN